MSNFAIIYVTRHPETSEPISDRHQFPEILLMPFVPNQAMSDKAVDDGRQDDKRGRRSSDDKPDAP